MKGKILIADDERTIRETVSMILNEEGYETDTVSNGKEALQRLEEKQRADKLSREATTLRRQALPGLQIET